MFLGPWALLSRVKTRRCVSSLRSQLSPPSSILYRCIPILTWYVSYDGNRLGLFSWLPSIGMGPSMDLMILISVMSAGTTCRAHCTLQLAARCLWQVLEFISLHLVRSTTVYGFHDFLTGQPCVIHPDRAAPTMLVLRRQLSLLRVVSSHFLSHTIIFIS